LNPNVRLAALVDDLEWEVLDIGLHFCIVELPTDETLGVEDTEIIRVNKTSRDHRTRSKEDIRVVWVHSHLVLRGVTNQPLVIGERDVGWSRSISLVVGNDFNTIILPDTDATAQVFGYKIRSRLEKKMNAYEYVVPRSIPIAFEVDILTQK
jgi:hypothetical protein